MMYVLIVAIGIALPIFGAGSAVVSVDDDPKFAEFRATCAQVDAETNQIDKGLKAIFTNIKKTENVSSPVDYIKSHFRFESPKSTEYVEMFALTLLLTLLEYQRYLALQGFLLVNNYENLQKFKSKVMSGGNIFIQELCVTKLGEARYFVPNAVQYDFLASLIERHYDSRAAQGVFYSLLQDIGKLQASTSPEWQQAGTLLIGSVYEPYVWHQLKHKYLSMLEIIFPGGALDLKELCDKNDILLQKIKELKGIALYVGSVQMWQNSERKIEDRYDWHVTFRACAMVYHWYTEHEKELHQLYRQLYEQAVQFEHKNRSKQDLKIFFSTPGRTKRIKSIFDYMPLLLPEPEMFAIKLRETPECKEFLAEFDRQTKEVVQKATQDAIKKKQVRDAREARRKSKEEAARVSEQKEQLAVPPSSVVPRPEAAAPRIPAPVQPVNYWDTRDGSFIRDVRLVQAEHAIECRYMCVFPENTTMGWPPRAYNCECMIYRWYEDEENRPPVALPIRYADSIGQWFGDPEKAVQSYLSKLSLRGHNDAIAARIMLSHMLPHVLDQYINRYASYDLWERRDRRYTVLSKLTIRSQHDGSIINDSYGVISWTLNPRNECYHRSFSVKIPEIAEQGAVAAQYAAEFPQLPKSGERPAQ